MRHAAEDLSKSDPLGAQFMRDDAAILEAQADKDLLCSTYTTGSTEAGNGGELVPLEDTDDIARHVAQPPETLAHAASAQRLELAAGADVLSLSLDAATALDARDSIERMIAQQAAAAHKLAMRLMTKADQQLSQVDVSNPARDQAHGVEAARLAHAAGKLMGAFNDAVLTVQRRRSGGRQVVQVIHQQVAVGAGGKAIVAGSLKGPGKTGGKRGPK
jgi:hypothetical protein